MKFDLIVSNPPYNRGMVDKILESTINLSDKLCFVHPAGWSGKTKKFLRDKVKQLELFDGNAIFGVAIQTDCAIAIYEPSNRIKVIKGDDEFFVDSIEKFHKYAKYPIYDKLMSHIDYSNSVNDFFTTKSPSTKFHFGIPIFRGNNNCPDFYTMCRKEFKHHLNNPKYKYGYSFSSLEEAENCYSYLCTKVARFLLSINKPGMSLDHNATNHIPWVDFTQPWNDEKCKTHFNITDEEFNFINSIIPDYYDN